MQVEQDVDRIRRLRLYDPEKLLVGKIQALCRRENLPQTTMVAKLLELGLESVKERGSIPIRILANA